MMKKQLNNYDGVLSQLEFGDKGYGTKKDKKYDLNKYDGVFPQFESEPKWNATKKDKNDDLNKYDGAFPQLELEDKGCTTNKEKKYNLGFLQSKIIKNIIYCLTERQQIGKKLNFVNFIKSTLISGLYFLILIYLELMMISSDLGLYTLLLKTGFFCTHGIFLLLLKVDCLTKI